MPDLLFLAGIPGAGKSEFAKWLVKEKTYVHFDLDDRRFTGILEEAGFGPLVVEYAKKGDDVVLIKGIPKLDCSFVWDWGFMPDDPGSLGIVKLLEDNGFRRWWFDADPGAAREAYLLRHARLGNHLALANIPNHLPMVNEAFNRQLRRIENAQDALDQLYGEHRLETLKQGGKRMTCEEIYRRIMTIK